MPSEVGLKAIHNLSPSFSQILQTNCKKQVMQEALSCIQSSMAGNET